MNYKEIQGWFNYEFLFKQMVTRFDDCEFIEVGCWKGKSTVYLGQEIKRQNKNIRVIAIDTWKGSVTEKQHKEIIKKDGEPLFDQFMDNIIKAEIGGIIEPLQSDSSIALNELQGIIKVPFIFLDGDHTFTGVMKDIQTAMPLIRPGGVLAGHDYGNAPGVTKAVNEMIGEDKIKKIKNVWIYQLP